MQVLLSLSFALVGGLLMSRLAKILKLPAVTAYLVTGLLLGPYCIGALNLFEIGFNTPEEVANLDIISQVALGFIAFTIGNEFRLEQLKHMGKQAITVGIAQAVVTTILVDIALVALHFANPGLISIPSAITLGSIAAATAGGGNRRRGGLGAFLGVLRRGFRTGKRYGQPDNCPAGAGDRNRSVPGLGRFRGMGALPGGKILLLPQ